MPIAISARFGRRRFGDGTETRLLGLWLRDNCPLPSSRTANGQRKFETETLTGDQITAVSATASADGATVVVKWAGAVNGSVNNASINATNLSLPPLPHAFFPSSLIQWWP